MPEEMPLWLVRLLNPTAPNHTAHAAPCSEVELAAPAADAPSGWAARYPDVPPPETTPDIRTFAARWACGDIHGDEVSLVAAQLIQAGFDSPGLRCLAGEACVTTSVDAAGPVEIVLREFNLPVPFPLSQARLTVSRNIARQVIAGQFDPWRACNRLEMIWGWSPENEDVRAILACMDETTWDPEHQRLRPTGLHDLLAAFAQLAQRPDNILAK